MTTFGFIHIGNVIQLYSLREAIIRLSKYDFKIGYDKLISY